MTEVVLFSPFGWFFFLFSSFFLSFSAKLWECDVYVWDACLPVRKRQSHEREAFKTMIKVATSFSSTFDSEWVEWNINSHRNQCEALHSHQYIMFTVTHTHINSCTCKYGTRFVFFFVFLVCVAFGLVCVHRVNVLKLYIPNVRRVLYKCLMALF